MGKLKPEKQQFALKVFKTLFCPLTSNTNAQSSGFSVWPCSLVRSVTTWTIAASTTSS
jgi:hypothetical protein